MKKILLAVMLAVTFAAHAQNSTNPPPSTPQGFFGNALLYLTSINTNYTFTPFKLWTEGDYQNQINFADAIDMSYDVVQPTSYTNGIAIDLEGGMRNAGIAGTIVSYDVGGAVAYNLYDTRIEGYVNGGYNQVFHKGYAEFGARALKKPTANTFLGFSLGFQVPVKGPSYPIVGVLAGATF